MAVPVLVGTARATGGDRVSFPSGTRLGDLIVVIQRASARLSDQAGGRGRIGNVYIQGASASQVATSGWSWTEYKPARTPGRPGIFRGHQYSQRVYAGTVTSASGTVQAPVPNTNSSNSALVVVYRSSGGVGATARDVWRVAASGPQSIGLFASTTAVTVPSGVAAVPGLSGTGDRVWTAPASGAFAGPGGAADGENPTLIAIEILGTSEPGPPVQLEPADGSEVANGVPVEFVWTHAAARPGGFQDAYRLRVTTPGDDPDDDPVERWWDGIGLVSSETDVVSTSSRLELPASVVGVDASLGWSVATREGLDGEWSDYSPVWSVASGEPPTVTVTGPTGPVHNTMRPVITWEAEPRPGEVLVQYQARLADEDGAFVFDTGGQQGNPGQHAVPALPDWINGGEYTPWVRVRQTRGAWSAWTSGDPFPVTWDEPQTPTVEAWSGGPGVLVQAAAPGLLAAEVERVNPDGSIAPVAGEAVGGVTRDVLGPYGQTVTYRARTSNTIADVTVYSQWASSGPVQSRDRYGYLADAADPARWIRFRLARATGLDPAPQEIETRAGLGDDRVMVDKGPILGRQGTFTARTDTIEEAEELLDMLQSPLLVFRRPAEQRYAGPSQVWRDRGVIVLTVNQQPREEPLADNYPLTSRLYTFGWVEQ